MRPLVALLVYIAVVFVGGALLAPWLYGLVGWLGGSFESFQNLAQQPFHRYLVRCFMVLALAGLWPLVKAFGIKDLRDLGLPKPVGEGRRFLKGFGLGFSVMAVMVIPGLIVGARSLDTAHTIEEFVRHLRNATLAAVTVGLIEEVLYRGAIFSALRRTSSRGFALAVSCGIFALVHFLARMNWPGEVRWDSGLQSLPQMLGGFADARQLLPGFFNLVLTGAILVRLYERTGTLYASIGLHASWIFWLKTAGFMAPLASAAPQWIWGSNKLVDGWVALPLMVLCWLAAGWLFPAGGPPLKEHA
jgi:membrane protease YdiL (CAAX protease family)